MLIDNSHRARHDLNEDRADDARRRRQEVHFRISSPPITHPDYYGIDTPEKEKLLAANHDVEGMRAIIGADSLAFLSVEGIYRAMGEEARSAQPQFTDHCFTGDYPTPLTDRTAQEARRASSRCWPKPADAAASWPEPLSNRIALVTGASRGIGAATALALAKAGAHVVAVARTAGGLEELDDEIRAAGGMPRWCRSTSRYRCIARLAAALDERYGRLDVLIGNAGVVGDISPLGHVEPKVLGRGHGDQRQRQLAPHPLPRSAAAEIGRRPRGVHHLRRRQQSRAPIGDPTRLEGGARGAGTHLCG